MIRRRGALSFLCITDTVAVEFVVSRQKARLQLSYEQGS